MFWISIGQASWNWMMISSHFLGRQKRNVVIISQVIQSRPSQSCTQDHLLPHQRTPLQRFPHSAFSLGPSYRVPTNSSFFPTVLVPIKLASGNLSELRCRIPCPRTLHASKMAVSLLNSTPVILLTRGTMQSTLASGCNIIRWVNFNSHYLRRKHILFDWLNLLRITPLGTNYFLFENGLTWHITIPSSMAHSNSLLSTAGKLGIISPNRIGMSLKPIVTCSTTHFHTLMCHHIQFMSTAEHTWCFTVMPLPVNW